MSKWITPEEDARAAMQMIRECIEELAPVGTLRSRDATLLIGPALVDEAQAICEDLKKLFADNPLR